MKQPIFENAHAAPVENWFIAIWDRNVVFDSKVIYNERKE